MKQIFSIVVDKRRTCSGGNAGAGELARPAAGGPVAFPKKTKKSVFSAVIAVLAALSILFSASSAGAAAPGTVISNTASVSYIDGSTGGTVVRNSNTTSLTTEAYRTRAVLELLQYAPSSPAAEQVPVSLSAYSTGGSAGPFTTITAPVPVGSSTPIDLSSPVPLAAAGLYHAGESVFIRLTDGDQNLDSSAAETVIVTVRNSLTGDAEIIRLTETGPDTGIFTGYVQTTSQSGSSSDGVLTVAGNSSISASYVDVADNTDTGTAAIMTDPSSKVLDATTGQSVSGASITLVNASTNQAATVYGDDGFSVFPATIVSGMTATDSGGKTYPFASGEYRFPVIPAGAYRLSVTPPAGYRAPSTVSTQTIQSLPGGPFTIVDPGSRGENFTVSAGSVIHIDIPIDPTGGSLFVAKYASKDTVARGDFLQYKVTVENTDPSVSVTGVVVNDVLPLGFRYRNGSTRINGAKGADPAISGDGRTLSFTIGTIVSGATITLSYVTEVAAGAKTGTARNRAVATGDGNVTSNQAATAVVVKDDFFSEKAFIVGQVLDGCGTFDAYESKGVAGVRLFLENGTYVVTDKNGMFHFEGVDPGTHVVQIDLETVPEQYEAVFCKKNSRFAETASSQFVDVQGGTLWRADFSLRGKAPAAGEAGIELRSALKKSGKAGVAVVEYGLPLQIGAVPVKNMRVTVMLPPGAVYNTGSSRLDLLSVPDPFVTDNALTFRLGDAGAAWIGTVRFSASVPLAGAEGELATQALLVFDSPGGKNEKTPVVDNVILRTALEQRQTLPDIVLHPQFATLSAELSARDKKSIDQVLKKMKTLNVKQLVVTGHTDSNKIRGRGMAKFRDNYVLSRARAKTVGDYIAAALKLAPDQITVIGKGPDEPVATNRTEKGRAQNRRVELQVTAENIHAETDLRVEKGSSGMKAVATLAGRPGNGAAQLVKKEPARDEATMPDFDAAWLAAADPGFGWIWPEQGANPSIPSTKIAVKHDPSKHLKLFVNNAEVSALNYEGTIKNSDRKVAVSLWIGIPLQEGDNLFEAVQYDEKGPEAGRIKKTLHYSGAPVKAVLAPEHSKLAADGRNFSVIAVLLTDKDGHPVREGMNGEYTLDPPYESRQRAEDLQKNPLTASTSDKLQYVVGKNGIALVELQPTTRTGEAIVRFTLGGAVHEVRAWLTPEKRDWILVGLADGTAGYNRVKGNMESLAESGENDEYYKDGRVAFYAKGTIKGEWLMTMAYDSNRHRSEDQSLYQTIDPNKYYTLYGDATEQRSDAASSRALYLKIERNQFYALFGDYDTGLTVTELSRYSRQLNGFKSELKSERADLTVFASQSDQAFVKDEIQGDGTSGLYHLSRKNLIINSETVVIETRDRYQSEVIVNSQSLSRYVDYSIDYESGAIWFKAPVFSTDENFNPKYIVVRYEVFDSSSSSYNYGGRGAVRLPGNRLEAGATGVHEESSEGSGTLTGMDATLKLNEQTKIRAEIARSRSEEDGGAQEGSAYLVEATHRTPTIESKAYVRELEPGFGLNQQNSSETGTRKFGYGVTYRMTEQFRLSNEAYRQENSATGERQDMIQAQGKYSGKGYEMFSGLLHAAETSSAGETGTSDQIFFGGRKQVSDRLALTFRHDQSVIDNAASDYPTRTTFGADYALNKLITLYGNQEMTWGAGEDTATSRIGLRGAAWTGGQVSSTMEQQASESGRRLFSTLGLKQTWQVNRQWSLDAGFDRSQTIRERVFETTSDTESEDSDTGSSTDFTAVSLGAGYRAAKWSWAGRVEQRTSDEEDKFSVFTGLNGELGEGVGLAAAVQAYQTSTPEGSRSTNNDFRIGFVYRPQKTDWIVLNRLDFYVDKQRETDSVYDDERLVNNLNINYKPGHELQIALQYACKYVIETIDDLDYRGYTDLIGLQGIRDLNKKWDIGLHGSILHSYSVRQYKYGSGISTGYSFMKNMLIRFGFNFTGFTDRDFSQADFTAQGPFIKFSLKFDQTSARNAVKGITGQ